MTSCRWKKPLTLNEEEVENLEDETVIPDEIIFFPPENANECNIDKDSGEEDNVVLNNLPGSQLRGNVEVVLNHQDEEINDEIENWDSEDEIHLHIRASCSEQPYAQLGVFPPHLERRIPSPASPATSKKGNRHPILSRLGINTITTLDYLMQEDRVMGFEDDSTKRSGAVADHVAVFMLRGVFKRWKQPVAFAFCKSAMKASSIDSFYKQIVAEAAAVGFNIIASVCDMGSNNVKAINDLLDYSKRLQTSEDDVMLDNVIRISLRDNQYH
ncbi:hypothetical protein TcasGA2_TC031015 [Tribolium castaneum]|uniref:Transposable element P transposase-like RNase H domain-containing protein n=1 Tax=Tribolium castaneum TaxID=7070 RepID=A0A139WA03_TRICA|nr:hypothetical protein TcasGA2_TC031015 [Tribolium castaneum]